MRIASTQCGEIRPDTGVSLRAAKALDPLTVPHTAIIVGARNIEQAVDGARKSSNGWNRRRAG